MQLQVINSHHNPWSWNINYVVHIKKKHYMKKDGWGNIDYVFNFYCNS